LRQSVEELNQFYNRPEGVVAKTMISAKLKEAWPDLSGLDVLGLGYATPYMEMFGDTRRTLNAMPAAQGAEIWPSSGKVRTVLIDDQALPFASNLFDRIVLVHALEESSDFQALLEEASRILAPNGRLIIVTTARGGLWALSENTPFGSGLPFSRRQLEEAVREAQLEPLAWSYGLYSPPLRALVRWAGLIERIAPHIWPWSGGVILMEAGRKPFVALKTQTDRSLISEIRQVLSPKPVPTAKTLENPISQI